MGLLEAAVEEPVDGWLIRWVLGEIKGLVAWQGIGKEIV